MLSPLLAAWKYDWTGKSIIKTDRFDKLKCSVVVAYIHRRWESAGK